ncbi:MAG TPA: hypothetical protein VJT32_16225 [bacterium]|nr:hypothetical protein [bacterium]
MTSGRDGTTVGGEAAHPLACDLTVFDDAQRDRHRALAQRVFAACRGARELPDGFIFHFAEEWGTLPTAGGVTIAEWISLERLCCPFLSLAVEFGPGRGVSLRITGDEPAKELFRQHFDTCVRAGRS